MLPPLFLKSILSFFILVIPQALHKFLILIMRLFLIGVPPFLRPQTEVGRRKIRLIYGGSFLLLIIIGLVLAEYKSIYVNATTLCLSCIGIK